MLDRPYRKIILAGGSGFLGRAMLPTLLDVADEIITLTRSPAVVDGRERRINWDAKSAGDWEREIDGADAIINLVGRTVDCRKTPANKKVILESRVHSVRALAAAVQLSKRPPKVWVQAATAHIFGDTGDEILDDNAPIGSGFAPQVGLAWEAATNDAPLPHTRRVLLRMTFVLGREGGPLKILARLARLGLGGTVGSGRQWISWIHEADVAAIVLRALIDPTMSGTYVVTAPGPVTNRDFMAALRHTVHRPWSPPTPAPLVRLGSAILRTDPELALLGRRCVPSRLLSEGYVFKHPDLSNAFDDLLTNRN